MPVSRVDRFTYGRQTIGDLSGTSTEVLDHYMFVAGQDDGEFVCRFAVRASGTTDAQVYADLESRCQMIEANLRMRYQKLEVDWGSSIQVLFDPSIAANAVQPLPPTTACVNATGGAGTLTAGAHVFWVTFVSAAGESVVGPASNAVTFNGSQAASLSAVPLGPAGTTARKIYLSTAGGTAPYLAATISDNVTTTATVSVADAALVTLAPGPLGMGFDQEPHLEKLRDFPNSANARGYEFRVRVGLPPNYVDAFGPAAGRRQVDATLRYDTQDRQVVEMTGEWTQVPSAYARQQFLAVVDGATGYANYRLGLVNAAIGESSDTWTVAQRNESDPQSLTTLRFVRQYVQHVNGRRGSAYSIRFTESGQRFITIQGVYLRTYTGSSFGSGATSSANYTDGTNGGQAFAVTTLAVLPTGDGGPLTVGQDCELLGIPVVRTNEQNDRTDYTLVYRELLFKQSSAAGNFLDDPNVVNDSVIFEAAYTPNADSPLPTAAADLPGPGDASSPSATLGGLSNFSDTGGTVFGVLNPSAGGGSKGASTPAQKPVTIAVYYESFLAKTVTGLRAYWLTNLLPYLLSKTSTQLGFSGGELVDYRFRADPTMNKIGATVLMRAYQGSVVSFVSSLARQNDTGVRVDAAFTGEDHAYLVQQALRKSFMSRRVEAVYLTSGAFTLDQFVSPQKMTGWVKLADAQPDLTTRVLGIPSQGVPQVSLTRAVLEEQFVWVATNVAGAAGAAVGTPAGAPSGFTPSSSFMPGD